jgi:L-ascorbate 6-phosphate lactonase
MEFLWLGQSGIHLRFGDLNVYADPYLTDSVAAAFGSSLQRQVPVPVVPSSVVDADWVLVSHDHLDHCDPDSLLGILAASPKSRIIGPSPVFRLLDRLGVPRERMRAASGAWQPLNAHVEVRAVPAAHPTPVADDKSWTEVGFVLRLGNSLTYFAGDTSPNESIMAELGDMGPFDTAFVPVNERNYFRDREGILGNMSVRECLQFATEIGVRKLIPIHWDMFLPNSVHPDEIRLVYASGSYPFELLIAEHGVWYR